MTEQSAEAIATEQIRERIKARRRELRQITSDRKRELQAEYHTAPSDALLTEQHIAADHQKSRAWVQWKRLTGDGPPFLRTSSGAIRYRKSDNEKFKAENMRQHRSTSEYEQAA